MNPEPGDLVTVRMASMFPVVSDSEHIYLYISQSYMQQRKGDIYLAYNVINSEGQIQSFSCQTHIIKVIQRYNTSPKSAN